MPDAPTSCTEKVFRLYIFLEKGYLFACKVVYNDTKYGGVCPFWHTPEAAWAERCIRHVSTARTTATCPCPHPQLVDKRRMTF